MMPKELSGAACRDFECEPLENVDDGPARNAANPRLTDITQDDENVISVDGLLLRRICALPGDVFLCRMHVGKIFSLHAYRGKDSIAYVYPSRRGFSLTMVGSPKVFWKPTLGQAWTALIRILMPENMSGHEQILWRETLKAEKRRIRNEPDYPARLLYGVPDRT